MRVLLIEDEEKLCITLKRGLERFGYAVDFVTDGEAGQRRLEVFHKEYDVAILDLRLPKVDGFQVLRYVRAQDVLTPIIVLAANDLPEAKTRALDLGADDYLNKPFSFNELMARLRALLRRPREAFPAELRLKDLQLNTTTRIVSRSGLNIYLTVKEFALLEYLMRHPGQVLNRTQIIDHLWGSDYDSFSNIVDVHLKNLRKKIDTDPHEKLLETVHGVGYRLKS